MIITARGECDRFGNTTGRWKDRISMSNIKDGTSHTFLVGELHIPAGLTNTIPFNGPIFNGEELAAHSRIGGPGVPIRTSNQDAGEIFGFGSAHPGNCNFAFADGSVRAVDNAIDTVVLADLCHRDDGNVVAFDQ